MWLGRMAGASGPPGRFRLGARGWSDLAAHPAALRISAVSLYHPFVCRRRPLSAGCCCQWCGPPSPTRCGKAACPGCVDHQYRLGTLSVRSKAVCHELSQFGRQGGLDDRRLSTHQLPHTATVCLPLPLSLGFGNFSPPSSRRGCLRHSASSHCETGETQLSTSQLVQPLRWHLPLAL